MIENFTEATPVEIDTEVAEVYERWYRVLDAREVQRGYLKNMREGNAKMHAGNRSYSSWTDDKVADLEAKVAGLSAQATAIFAEQIPHQGEYQRRGGWTRAYLVVTKGAGHVHRAMHCNTCYNTTQFAWLPQMSGKAEVEIVEAAGERACTVCYPSAPVEVLARPTTLFSKDEIAKQAERDAKAAAKVERDAAKAAKAIANPDGSSLRDSNGWTLATERTAEIEYVDSAAYVIACDTYGYPHTGRIDITRSYVERFLAAVAAKHGTTVEAQRERLAPKVTKRLKRDYA